MPPRTDPRAGFMLVEVLAALAITVALVAVVLPYASQLMRRWATGQASVAGADAWMQAVARLSDDVAEALPAGDVAGDGRAPGFALGARRLDLVRPALGSADGQALERVSYQAETASGGERLVRRSRPFPGDEGDGAGAAIAIMDGPYTFRFAATGKDGRRAAQWADARAMPLRLDLTLTATGTPRTPFKTLVLPLVARSAMAVVVPLLRQRP